MPAKTKQIRALRRWAGFLSACLLVVLGALFFLDRGFPLSQPETPTGTTGPTIPPNVFSPEDFGYVDGYLSCLTQPSVLGIDVSVHQKQIDWAQVAAAGVEFVMIRLAYRGSIEGVLSADEMAQTYYEGAKAAGLKVGGYIFTQSISAEEGLEDAEFVLDIVKDWQLDMPLVYDWEIVAPHYRNGSLDKRTLTDTMLAFCEKVEKAGHEAMVYFNVSQTQDNFYLQELTDYGFWLARYADQMDFPYKVDMWQYTNQGAVPGIEGYVDINLFFPYE